MFSLRWKFWKIEKKFFISQTEIQQSQNFETENLRKFFRPIFSRNLKISFLEIQKFNLKFLKNAIFFLRNPENVIFLKFF